MMTQAREALDLAESHLAALDYTVARHALKAAMAWLRDEYDANSGETGRTFEALKRRHNRLEAHLRGVLL